MKKLIVILMLIAVSASARIGETKEECIKRYGKVLGEKGIYITFAKPPMVINIIIYKGKVHSIIYTKYNVNMPNYPFKLSSNEIQKLLKSNYSKWSLNSDGYWISANKKLRAQIGGNKLIILTNEYLNVKLIENEREENKKLSGF